MKESALMLANINMAYPVCGLAIVTLGLAINLLIVIKKNRQLTFVHQEMIDKMQKRIASQEKSLIGSYLLSLLKGRMTKFGGKEQELGSEELSFNDGNFALVGCHVPLKAKTPELDELDFFVVDNVFSELMEGENFYRIEDGRFIFYFFCIAAGNEEMWNLKAQKQSGFLCDYLKEKFKMNLTVAISQIETDISRAKHMYQSVMEAFEYQKIVGGNGVIRAIDLRESQDSNQVRSFYLALTQAVESGRTEEALSISGQMFEYMGKMPLILLRLKALEAFQTIADSYSTYIKDSAKQIQFLSWMETLLNAEDETVMKTKFDEMILYASGKIKGQREAEGRSIVKSVKEYIEKNYADSCMNLSTVAEALGRNARYLSKVFREETGEGLLDYVNVIRIGKATELLAEGNYSVETVGEMVGYASTKTFRRIFTKIVGTTPSNFL